MIGAATGLQLSLLNPTPVTESNAPGHYGGMYKNRMQLDVDDLYRLGSVAKAVTHYVMEFTGTLPDKSRREGPPGWERSTYNYLMQKYCVDPGQHGLSAAFLTALLPHLSTMTHLSLNVDSTTQCVSLRNNAVVLSPRKLESAFLSVPFTIATMINLYCTR